MAINGPIRTNLLFIFFIWTKNEKNGILFQISFIETTNSTFYFCVELLTSFFFFHSLIIVELDDFDFE